MLNFRHGIYIIIFLMPLYLWRFSICGIPTTVLEMMIYILFLAWVFNRFHPLLSCHFELVRVRNLRVLLCRKNVYIKTVLRSLNRFAHFEMTKREKAINILNIGILLLFLGLAISTSNSSDSRTSLGIFKGWFIDPLLFFVVFINVIKKEKHLILSLKSWLVSGVAVSLISIFYLLNNDLTFDGRLKAFFLSPNHLAMYISPVLLIALVLLLSDKKLNIKYWILNIKKLTNYELTNLSAIFNIQYLIFLIIILIPLYFTYSYGAFLGIIIAIIYLFISKIKSAKILRNPISNIQYPIFLIIISFSLIFISSNKFDQVISSNERSSFHSRLMIWNASVEIIKDNPLLGIGPGTFQDVYLSYSERFGEQYLEWAVPQPHNIFLAFYLQTGLVGFVGFILVLFWFFGNSNNLKNKSNIQYLIFNILTCLMIYILIHGLVDTTYWKNDLSLMFWMAIGMMAVLRRMSNDTQYIK